MIQLQNVTKRIKENTVLDNVSYTFKSGFVYGLYGQNGSGKTMLLRAISGLINLDSGSIFIDSRALQRGIEFWSFIAAGIPYSKWIIGRGIFA